uniref:Gamma-secretase subunit APH-1 n=1 Tax=Panthera leo TaxID=9689 RepID=A0A8C8Y0X1_PANLE
MVSQGRGTGGGGWTPPSPREVKTCTCSKGLLFSPSSLTSKERWSGGKVGVGGIVTGNGARSLVIRLQRSLTLMRPSFPPVSGLSFGIISGVFSVINILADALGPGVVGIHGDSPYYFLTSAFLTAAIILLHTFWGVVFFDACERRRYWALGLVVGSHLLTSGLTFLNPWYEASLLPIYAVTVSMGLWAFITAGGSLRSIQRSLSCRRQEDSRVMVYSALRIPPED